jgi:purine-binding chemotaxis protein CheW
MSLLRVLPIPTARIASLQGKSVAPGLHDILVCEVGGQRFGLSGSTVRELLRAVFISPLPQSPRFVEGVINLRGTIVPVLDMRQWLGLPAKALEPSDHLVLLEADERLAAIRVDRALELAQLEAAAVSGGDYGAEGRAPARVVKLADGLLVLPDLAGLLAQVELPGQAAGVVAAAPNGEGVP